MQKSEVAKLLTFVHSVQGGEPNQVEVAAWHDLIGHLDYDDAMQTAIRHFRSQARRIWPVDIIRGGIQKNERWMYGA
jgi:hypothetical protein